ncbi:MAG TPA: type VI secretion protein IcmF/TssM N-terminal domain-containing protein [Thermoanaerobaculia bacterium]|jgi:type VI secretion system protein ImpL
MKDLLAQLFASLPFVLGAILLLLALLLLALVVLLGRARDSAEYADFEGGEPREEDGGGEPTLKVVDFRDTPAAAELRESLDRTLRLLRQYLPGRRPLYALPWFLSLGPAAAGKTTLLSHSTLKPPFGEPEGTSTACQWWLFDRAVVLDVAGDLVLRLDGRTSDGPAWRALLDLLRRYRTHRPLDGALLSVPLTDLLAYDAADAASLSALAHRAELLRNRLEEARKALGFEFPVHFAVTQCDRLPGFADFVAALEPEQRNQMLGWSVPTSPDVPYSDSQVDDAFESIVGALDRQQLRALREAPPLAEPRAFLALPAAFGALREALRIYWNQIFSGGEAEEALPVRGLYFLGGEGFDREAPPQPSPGYRSFGPAAAGQHRRVDFVGDLWSYKILFEWSLARPQAAVERRRRRRQTALQIALAAALVAGPLMIWSGHRTMTDAANRLSRDFLLPARAALGHRDTAELRASAMGLLPVANLDEDYELRSALLPASWWNRYAGRVRQTAVDAYGKVVFPAIAGSLGERLAAAASAPVPAEPAGEPRTPVYDLPSIPQYGELDRFLRQLADIQTDVRRYDEMASTRCNLPQRMLADFSALLRSFEPGFALNPPAEAAGFYTGVLCDAVAPPFPTDPPLQAELKGKVLAWESSVTRQLFEKNALVLDLDELQAKLDELARTAPPAATAYQVYGALLADIQRTAADLLRPQLTWAGKSFASLEAPGTLYRNLLDQVDASRFLGSSLAETMSREDAKVFAGLRDRLAHYSTAATGPLLVVKDGQAQLKLAANILGLETALQALLTRYVQPAPGRGFAVTPPGGTYLSWNDGTLQQAAALYASYQSFMSGNFAAFPGFQQLVSQSTQQAVESNVLTGIAGAQSFPAGPQLSTRALRESFLQAQIANLAQAATPLNALLAGFSKPPLVTGCGGSPKLAYCQLSRALANQQGELLQELDDLRGELGLYQPVPGSFAAWHGGAAENLAWMAFGASDADGLGAYLTNQRRVVQTLSDQYATPILGTVPLGADLAPSDGKSSTASASTAGATATAGTKGATSATGAGAAAEGDASGVPLRRWKLIQSDLGDYKNKAPGNALLLLETFITESMGKATTESCLKLPPPSTLCFSTTTPPGLAYGQPCDLFLDDLKGLQKQTAERCLQLNYGAGEAAYGRVKMAFDSHLLGKYPFTAGTESPASSATDRDLTAFFAVFDAEKVRLTNFFAAGDRSSATQPASPASPWPAATSKKVRAFLDDMAKVRSFFAPYLDRNAAPAAGAASAAQPAAAKPPDVPAFGLLVNFRPQPGSERRGNEIIERSLQTGQVALSASSGPPPAGQSGAAGTPPLWLYGQSLALSLRWAQNAPTVPAAPTDPLARVDGRTVTYTYPAPWSVLRLLAASAGAAGTLAFEIPVAAAPAPAGTESGGTERGSAAAKPAPAPARIYISLTLTTPDAAQTVLAVPAFPTEAPAVPAAGT